LPEIKKKKEIGLEESGLTNFKNELQFDIVAIQMSRVSENLKREIG